jgi:hypothetical protein
MLGADCVLVRRTPAGFRGVDRDEASAVQKCALDTFAERDWLFRQCERIAAALNKGEIALAQIYGLRIPVGELDERRLSRIAAARFAKTGFNPDEPRLPSGDPHGGEWTTGGGVAAEPADLMQLYADIASQTGAQGSDPTAGSRPTAASTGGESRSASSSTEPSISFRTVPPPAPAPRPPAQEPGNSGPPATLDSPDLQPDPTTGTLDSPDLQLPDVSVVADAPDNPILTIPGIDAINADSTMDDLLFFLMSGGLVSPSRILARNLIRSGEKRALGDAAHHIVAAKALRADPARQVLDRFGIGFHDAVNGVFLPEALHNPLHKNLYYDAVNEALARATTRSEAEQILRSIARRLKAWTLP